MSTPQFFKLSFVEVRTVVSSTGLELVLTLVGQPIQARMNCPHLKGVNTHEGDLKHKGLGLEALLGIHWKAVAVYFHNHILFL